MDWTNRLRLRDLERQYGLPSNILSSVMDTESKGNPKALSPAGAKGLFQFMDPTAKELGVDPWNPESSAHGAAKMLHGLLNKYGGDVNKALAGYNWGQGNVDRKGLQNAPSETRNYIAKVRSGMATAKPSSGFIRTSYKAPSKSNASPFDPDAFLAETASSAPSAKSAPEASSFDPDRFLAETEERPAMLVDDSTPTLEPTVVTAKPEGEVPLGRKVWTAARPWIAPALEAAGATGGAILGAGGGTILGGPVGTIAGGVGGAGVGYAGAKELLELGDVYLGGKPARTVQEAVTQPLKNIGEGAAWEMAGQVVPTAVKAGVSWLKARPERRAIAIVKGAIVDDATQAANALRNAPEGASVAEITAGIKNPTWQALVEQSLGARPRSQQYLTKLAGEIEEQGTNALAKMAGGGTATEAREAVTTAKGAVREVTTPLREAALDRANLGKEVARLEGMAAELGEKAAAEVQKVRHLMELGDLAQANARLNLIKRGLPVGATKYTYMSELAEKAFGEWSSRAADASLDLGQGARFAQDAADNLRKQGIKPLEGEPLIRSLKAIANNPEFAGNDVLLGALSNVADDIAKWTSGGGIIDARALDAIRKNSVNAAIARLRPGMDATSQRNLAAGVLGRVKPLLDDAIESAGGAGYKAYLAKHANLSQKVAEKQLSGEALRLWKTDKDGFVRLVMNESPEVVEKFLGPGKYNLAVEMAEDTVASMQKMAKQHLDRVAASKHATEGTKTLTQLLKQTSFRWRAPAVLNSTFAIFNKGLSELEKAIGEKTMNILSTAMMSPTKAADLLEALPSEERARVLQLISNPSRWATPTKSTISGAGVATREWFRRTPEEEEAQIIETLSSPSKWGQNRLAPASQSQNRLAQ